MKETMLAHKLVLDDVDIPFKLLAIHCSLEGYRLAFLLNKHLDLQLARTREEKDHDLTVKSGIARFPLFTYDNRTKYCEYFFMGNRSYVEAKAVDGVTSLFGEGNVESNPVYLLPQYKSVDFLLKIEEEGDDVSSENLVEQINKIPEVSTAYIIETENLKFKENLIFD